MATKLKKKDPARTEAERRLKTSGQPKLRDNEKVFFSAKKEEVKPNKRGRSTIYDEPMEQVTIQLPLSLIARINTQRHGQNRSAFLRELIEDHI